MHSSENSNEKLMFIGVASCRFKIKSAMFLLKIEQKSIMGCSA